MALYGRCAQCGGVLSGTLQITGDFYCPGHAIATNELSIGKRDNTEMNIKVIEVILADYPDNAEIQKVGGELIGLVKAKMDGL